MAFKIKYGPQQKEVQGKPVLGIEDTDGSQFSPTILQWAHKNYASAPASPFFSCGVGCIGDIFESTDRSKNIPKELMDECIKGLNASIKQGITFCSLYVTPGHKYSHKTPVLHEALLRNGWKEGPRFINKWHETFHQTVAIDAKPSDESGRLVFIWYVEPQRLFK